MLTYYPNENSLMAEHERVFLVDSLCLRKAKHPAVMSRPQLGCICIPNTESTPAVQSSKLHPGTGYKIVRFSPVSQVFWNTGQAGWILSVHS